MWMIRKLGLRSFSAPISALMLLSFGADIRQIYHSNQRDGSGEAATPGWAAVRSIHSAKSDFTITREKEATATAEAITSQSAARAMEENDASVSNSSSSIVSHHFYPEPRPPLDSLVDSYTNDVRKGADVSWLLDFAVIGFGKCGTTTIMEWLDQHPQLQCIQEEVWALSRGKPKGLVNRLYNGLPDGSQYRRGYKCPADITDLRVLNYYRRYWPRTKLFIGVRYVVPLLLSNS